MFLDNSSASNSFISSKIRISLVKYNPRCCCRFSLTCNSSIVLNPNASAIASIFFQLMFWLSVLSIREMKLTDKSLFSANSSWVNPLSLRTCLINFPIFIFALILHLASCYKSTIKVFGSVDNKIWSTRQYTYIITIKKGSRFYRLKTPNLTKKLTFFHSIPNNLCLPKLMYRLLYF